MHIHKIFINFLRRKKNQNVQVQTKIFNIRLADSIPIYLCGLVSYMNTFYFGCKLLINVQNILFEQMR